MAYLTVILFLIGLLCGIFGFMVADEVGRGPLRGIAYGIAINILVLSLIYGVFNLVVFLG